MASPGWVIGTRILRTAPWLPLLGTAVTAVLLLVIADLGHRTGVAPVTALLALSVCGGCAAYVLDEEAAEVADATPTSRLRRLAWRMPIVGIPGAVILTGLIRLNGIEPASHWLRLLPVAAGSLATGLAFAAAMRRIGSRAPGDQAGLLVLAVTVMVFAVNPLGRWVPAVPLGQTPHWERSALLWTIVAAVAVGVTVACSQDPAHRVKG